MSDPLSPEQKTSYTHMIDAILGTVDLETVTQRTIRSRLEAALGGTDLSTQKKAIKKLIEERFDTVASHQSSSPPALSPPRHPPSPRPSPKRKTKTEPSDDEDGPNGIKREDNSRDSTPASRLPPKKKHRRSEDTEDSDAKLAAMLQEQENMGRARATRGGATRKAAAKPKRKKNTPAGKKGRGKGGDGEGDGDGSEVGVKRRKAGGGLQKPLRLSEALAEVCGESQLPRPQVVKKMWEHIKRHDLQDPNHRRTIRCDDKLYAVLKQARVDMFQMNKLIGSHLYPVEEGEGEQVKVEKEEEEEEEEGEEEDEEGEGE